MFNRAIIDETTLRNDFLSAPGDDLVDKTILQLQKIPQMVKLFGPAGDSGSWANYNRFDWPVRSLPAINIFESNIESKTSDNGWLNGTVQIQVYWPSDFRRGNLARVPGIFKGILENFFNSAYVSAMLDELSTIQRDAKVYGLNEYGKTLSWSPNVEGITDGELTPVTILDVQYRIDLRAWERALEYMNRTVADPFEISLSDLTEILGGLEGVNDKDEVLVTVPLDIAVNETDEG